MTNEEISLYATEFRNRVLRGRSSSMMCVALSAPLMAALDAQGVACELQETGQYDLLHSFIKLDDGLQISSTATVNRVFHLFTLAPLPVFTCLRQPWNTRYLGIS